MTQLLPIQTPTSVAHDISRMADGRNSLDPGFAVIACSAAGNNEIVAATVGKKIRVLCYNFMGNGAVNAKWTATSGDLTGLSYLDAAGKGKVVPFCPIGWFETEEGEALNLNLSGAVAVGGELVYVLVTP